MLPWPYRLYFWGVHGIFAEVVFTAVWELAVSGKPTFFGFSSLWSFLTYGGGTFFFAEPFRAFLMRHGYPTWQRCLLYLPLTYAAEFAFGAALSYVGACPWDYSHFDYNVMGLITLEYAPFWLAAGACFEGVMAVMSSLSELPRWRK